MRQSRTCIWFRKPAELHRQKKTKGLLVRLALVLGLEISGCSAPKTNYGNCVAVCAISSDCAAGMECRQSLCVAQDWPGSCPTTGVGGGNSAATGGSRTGPTIGGSSQLGASTGGTAGESIGGSNGTATDTTSVLGGATGVVNSTVTEGNTDGGNVAIIGGSSAWGSVATGSVIDVVGGVGGVPSFGGSITGSVAGMGGLATGGIAGNGGSNSGTDGGADADVGVGGSDAGQACTRTNTPQIETQSLNFGCLGEHYTAHLSASGNGDYTWGASIPAGLGLVLAANGSLAGVLRAAGEFAIDIWAQDSATGCVSATQRFTLTVNDEITNACPTIKVKGKSSSLPAPESCIAWPYLADFEVSGGSAPYTWQALTTPPGLTFDSTSHRASGNPTDAGTLVLQVTDATGRVVQRSFAVPQRESCWFAYISNESGSSRLHLFDPLLGARLQRPTSVATGIAVTDFKFSPDGKFVAYRVKDANNNNTLWLWQAPGWDHEQQLDLGGSVTQYAWSENGQTLAVTFSTATDTHLGGVSVAGVPNTQTVAGIQGLVELQPILLSSVPVDSEIIWYGNDKYVAFSQLYPDYGFRILTQAAFGSSGFGMVTTRDTEYYDPSLILRSSDLGFFPIVPAASVLYFISNSSPVRVNHGDVAVAPTGAYVALETERRLNLYQPMNATFPSPPTTLGLAAAPNCDAIVGWSAEQVRVACVDETQGIAVSHTIDPVQGAVVSAAIQGSEVYVSSGWQGYRRLLSPTGNWAALGTGTQLYVADLSSNAPAIAWSAALGSSPASLDLSFSPSEQFLAVEYGTMLRIFITSSPSNGAFIGTVTVGAPTCQEQLLWASDWCGQEPNRVRPVWSSDSELLGFVSADQQLMVADLRAFVTQGQLELVQVASNCGGDCTDTGRFQP